MSKKNQILQTALQIFADKGYENTNLEEIAKMCNVTKPAIYYYFKNKEDLYNEIFKNEFEKLSFTNYNDFEKNLQHYVFTLGEFFFKNPKIAKLFSKELASEATHLNDDTLKIISKTLKYLSAVLNHKNVNPIFIQTLIVSTFTTYTNTLNLRERVSGIIKNEKLLGNFDITEEIYKTVKQYLKAVK